MTALAIPTPAMLPKPPAARPARRRPVQTGEVQPNPTPVVRVPALPSAPALPDRVRVDHPLSNAPGGSNRARHAWLQHTVALATDAAYAQTVCGTLHIPGTTGWGMRRHTLLLDIVRSMMPSIGNLDDSLAAGHVVDTDLPSLSRAVLRRTCPTGLDLSDQDLAHIGAAVGNAIIAAALQAADETAAADI